MGDADGEKALETGTARRWVAAWQRGRMWDAVLAVRTTGSADSFIAWARAERSGRWRSDMASFTVMASTERRARRPRRPRTPGRPRRPTERCTFCRTGQKCGTPPSSVLTDALPPADKGHRVPGRQRGSAAARQCGSAAVLLCRAGPSGTLMKGLESRRLPARAAQRMRAMTVRRRSAVGSRQTVPLYSTVEGKAAAGTSHPTPCRHYSAALLCHVPY